VSGRGLQVSLSTPCMYCGSFAGTSLLLAFWLCKGGVRCLFFLPFRGAINQDVVSRSFQLSHRSAVSYLVCFAFALSSWWLIDSIRPSPPLHEESGVLVLVGSSSGASHLVAPTTLRWVSTVAEVTWRLVGLSCFFPLPLFWRGLPI